MNTQEENINKEDFPQLVVSEDMRSYIYDMARWMRFIGMVGFFVSAMLVFASIFAGSSGTTNPQVEQLLANSKMSPEALTVAFLFYAVIVFYPSLMMFKFSSKAKQGVLYGEQESLNTAFSNLKSLFKFWGIIALIFTGLYLLTMLSGIG